MPTVTTQSGQARGDLVSLFKQAQDLARQERDRAAELQAVIDAAVTGATETDVEGQVCVRMSPQAWAQLRERANHEP